MRGCTTNSKGKNTILTYSLGEDCFYNVFKDIIAMCYLVRTYPVSIDLVNATTFTCFFSHPSSLGDK